MLGVGHKCRLKNMVGTKRIGARVYCEQMIDLIEPVQLPVIPCKGQRGMLQVTWPLSYQVKDCSTSKIMHHKWPHTANNVNWGSYPSAEVQSAYSTAPFYKAPFYFGVLEMIKISKKTSSFLFASMSVYCEIFLG